ncbi:MAG: DMT family transporter [Deferribacterales bacterium]
MNKPMLRAHISLLLWAFIVGLSFPVVSALTDGLPPVFLTSFRFIIAILALVPFLRGEAQLIPSKGGMVLYILMSLCLAVFFSGMFWAANVSTSLSMATLYLSIPLLSYAVGRSFNVERKDLKMLAILLLGAVGALMLAFVDAGRVHGNISFGIGELVFFVGCVASALYPVLTKFGLKKGLLSPSSVVRTFWSLFLGSIIMAVIGFAVESPSEMLRMNMYDLMLVIYLGIFSSGVTFWLQQSATSVLTPASVTAYSYLVPFVSMVILFIDEPSQLSFKWLPGSVMVVGAIYILLRYDMKAK